MRFYQLITFGALLVLPFFPRQLNPWITYIITAYAIALVPLFVRNFRINLVTVCFSLFLIASVLSTIFSIDKIQSLAAFTLFVSYFIIFVSIGSVFKSFQNKERFAGIFLFVVFILSQVSLYTTLVQGMVNKEREGVGFMWVYYGHNHLSSLLLFAIPICFYFLNTYWSNRIYRAASLFVLFVLLFSFFFTFARASLVALVLALLVSFVLFRKALNQKKALIFFVPLLVGIVFIGLSITRAKNFGVGKYELNWPSRTIYWLQAFDNASERLLTGSGLDTFRIMNRQSQRTGAINTYYAHNFFLQMLSDVGILGFFSSAFLIFSVLFASFEKVTKKLKFDTARLRQSQIELKKKEAFLLIAFWVGLLASTFNSMVDFDWQLPTVFFVFWMTAGMF